MPTIFRRLVVLPDRRFAMSKKQWSRIDRSATTIFDFLFTADVAHRQDLLACAFSPDRPIAEPLASIAQYKLVGNVGILCSTRF